jgi:hypothetical protein
MPFVRMHAAHALPSRVPPALALAWGRPAVATPSPEPGAAQAAAASTSTAATIPCPRIIASFEPPVVTAVEGQ